MSDNWWEVGEENFDDVSVAELNQLCKKMYDLKAEHMDLKSRAAAVDGELKKLQQKVVNYLEHFNMTEYSGEFGKVSRVRKFSVSARDMDKPKFFEYLKKQGHFEEIISVNARTLNSYVRGEIEEKTGKGIYEVTDEEIAKYKPEGLGEAKSHFTLSMKK